MKEEKNTSMIFQLLSLLIIFTKTPTNLLGVRQSPDSSALTHNLLFTYIWGISHIITRGNKFQPNSDRQLNMVFQEISQLLHPENMKNEDVTALVCKY